MCFKSLEKYLSYTIYIYNCSRCIFLYLLLMMAIKKSIKYFLYVSFYTYIFNNIKFCVSVYFSIE